MAAETTSSASQFNDPRGAMALSHFASTLSTAISVKLDRDNYSVWRSQVLPAIIGHNLQGFVDGTKTCLPEFLESKDDEGKITRINNVEYEQWRRED